MSRRIKKKNITQPEVTAHQEVPECDTNMYDHLKPKNVAAKKQAIRDLNQNNGSTKVLATIVGSIIIVALVFSGIFSGEFGSIDPVLPRLEYYRFV